MGGSLLATNSIAKLFGTSLGETGFGLKAFATSTDEAGKKTSPFRAALADTESGGNKLTRGLKSVADNGLNPMGLAIIAGGFLLDKLGESQQKAAEAAAAHRENVRSLTDAIRQDNGVMGEHANAVNVEALSSKNAASNLAIYGGTLSEAKLAIQGNAGATAVLTNKSDDLIASFVKQSGMSMEATKGLQGINHSLLENGGNYESVADQVTKFSEQTTLAVKKNADGSGTLDQVTKKLTASQREQLVAIFNGNGAIGEQVKAQREAYDAYLTSESALSGLTTEQVRNRDATNESTAAMYNQQNAQLGYRGAVLSTQQALENQAKVNKDGKSTDLDRAAAALAVERAFSAQEQAAYNTAYANSTASTEAQKVTEANAAMNTELVKLANTMGSNLPASMEQSIAKMNATSAVAAGLTVGIDSTGNAVYRLPDGKVIKLQADTGAANSALAYLASKLDAIHGKTVTVTTSFVDVYNANTRSQTGAYRMYAKGGLVGYASGGRIRSVPKLATGGFRPLDVTSGGLMRGPGTGTSDDIPMLTSTGPAMGSNREFVVKADKTAKWLPLLQDINNGTNGFAAGGLVMAEDGSMVPSSFYDKAPAGPHAMYTASGFAKLRANAMAGGIGSLSAMDQNQLRTYGGWTDAPVASSAPSGYRPGGSGSSNRSIIEIRSSGSSVDNFLLEILRNAIRVQGGDVQVVLGQ